jgi:hypothetical protein
MRQPNAYRRPFGDTDRVAELHARRYTRSMEHRIAIPDR